MCVSTGMQPIALTDHIQLECTRGGGCCHAQRIPLTPWEIAGIAAAKSLSPGTARDRYTCEGGTRLKSSGVADAQGRRACGLHEPGRGCSVHAGRPLACRLFPLGRRLDAATPTYHLAGTTHPCNGPCPTFHAQPTTQVASWLAGQGVGPGETAHDAYGRLVNGLLGQAAALDAPASETFATSLRLIAAKDAATRAADLPWPWYELLTAPGLMDLVDDPSAFVHAHAERLLSALRAGFGGDGTDAAILVATLAMHLGDPLGIPSTLAAEHAIALRGTASVALSA